MSLRAYPKNKKSLQDLRRVRRVYASGWRLEIPAEGNGLRLLFEYLAKSGDQLEILVTTPTVVDPPIPYFNVRFANCLPEFYHNVQEYINLNL